MNIKENLKSILVVCSVVYAGMVWLYKINQHEPRLNKCESEIASIRKEMSEHNTNSAIELAKINTTLQEVKLGVAQIHAGLIDLGLGKSAKR